MKYIYLLMLMTTMLLACDSGDIYPEKPTTENVRTLSISLSLNGISSLPTQTEGGRYQRKLALLVYEDGNTTPKVKQILAHDGFKEGETNVVEIDYISNTVNKLELAITNQNNEVIYSFKDITVPNIDASNPEEDITTEVSFGNTPIELITYERLQVQLFDQACIICHTTGATAPPPNLTEKTSYNNILEKDASRNKTFKLIKTSDAANSYLYKVLTEDLEATDGINPFHLGNTNLKLNDIELLKVWINAGAKNN